MFYCVFFFFFVIFVFFVCVCTPSEFDERKSRRAAALMYVVT
jgi:hypothetical protein